MIFLSLCCCCFFLFFSCVPHFSVIVKRFELLKALYKFLLLLLLLFSVIFLWDRLPAETVKSTKTECMQLRCCRCASFAVFQPSAPVSVTVNRVGAHVAVVTWTAPNVTGTTIRAYYVQLRRGNANASWITVVSGGRRCAKDKNPVQICLRRPFQPCQTLLSNMKGLYFCWLFLFAVKLNSSLS